MKRAENSYIEVREKEAKMTKRRLVDVSADRDIEDSSENHQRRKDVEIVKALLFKSSVWDNT